MTYRFLMEFVVDVPNEAVAGDVRTRLNDQRQRLVDIFTGVTGHPPLAAPAQVGFAVSGPEPVRWDAGEQDWIDDDDDDD